MANEYLRLQDTQMNLRKAQNILAVVEEKRKTDPEAIQSENKMFESLWKSFKDFFSNLGKPSLKLRVLDKTAPALSSDYNSSMKELADDIQVAYGEAGSLGQLIVKNYNYGESQRKMLLNSVKKINSKNIDYSFFAVGQIDRTLYGIDSFIDTSKVDFTKVGSDTTAAEIVTDQGVVTLRRIGNIDRSGLVRNVTGIKESLQAWEPIAQLGGYEGLYFGMEGEARPEGGQWHLEYSANGTTLYEKGASEEELGPRRKNMFDGNPETFWEAEFITNTLVGYQNKYNGNQISVAEFQELRSNEIDSPNVEIKGDTIVTSEYGSLIEDYIPVTQTGAVDFLRIDFIVNLSRSVMMNWINLNPNNFGTENYIDILSIETSEDGQSFVRLEGFDDHEFDTVLTREANEELTPGQALDTLSPDKFKYAGQGIWTFAPRKVNMIKFSLRQPQSYIKPYEVLKYETKQEYTTTTVKNESILWWTTTSTSVDKRTEIRTVELPYLEGLINGFDILSLGSAENGVDERAWTNIPFGIWGGSKEVTTQVNPETVTRQWRETKLDKSRFAIGIRDIGMYSYEFAETSEVVSQPYHSPKPIAKVSVSVDEFVPKQFYLNAPGTENHWIKYYISVDDGTSWARISPTNHNRTVDETSPYDVPQIININSDISLEARENPRAYIDTPAPVYQVRFKAVLIRPEDLADSASYTPTLSKYALKLYPFGGL